MRSRPSLGPWGGGTGFRNGLARSGSSSPPGDISGDWPSGLTRRRGPGRRDKAPAKPVEAFASPPRTGVRFPSSPLLPVPPKRRGWGRRHRRGRRGGEGGQRRSLKALSPMGGEILQPRRGRVAAAAFWSLIERQHGVVARSQLLQLGLSQKEIAHRMASGRLHQVWRGVYAAGRPRLDQRGRWMAAVLACGRDCVLSHHSAAALWGIRPARVDEIEVSVPQSVARSRAGIVCHRRAPFGKQDVTRRDGIPTSPVCTLVDLAPRLERGQLEAAINEADRLDLISPQGLRSALDHLPRRPGLGVLRRTLDRRTLRLTDSALERRFLVLVRRARLPLPETGRYVGGFKVDFYWPELELVIETDGLRYHRTPAEQARDRLRWGTQSFSERGAALRCRPGRRQPRASRPPARRPRGSGRRCRS